MDSSDDTELISHEAEQFYDEVRGLVVVFLFFAFFLSMAHLALQYFLSKPEYESKSNRVDRLVYQLVAGICTFTLTIGFTSYSLLPFSIMANEILFIYPQSYYVQWLNTELVQDLSLVANIGLKISSILIPFSFFLSISQGFCGRSSTSLSSRLLDALINLVLFYVLIFGSIWSVTNFLCALHNCIFGISSLSSSSSSSSSNDFPTNQYSFDHLVRIVRNSSWTDFVHEFLIKLCLLHALDLVQVAISLVGLCLLSLFSPMGLLGIGLRLIKSCINSVSELTQTTHLKQRLDQLNFETLTIMDDLQSSLLLYRSHVLLFNYRTLFCFGSQLVRLNPRPCTDIRIHDEFVLHYANQLALLRQEVTEIRERVSRTISSVFRTCMKIILCLISLFLLIMFVRVMESFVVINIVKLLLDLVFGKKSISNQDAGWMGSSAGLVSSTSSSVSSSSSSSSSSSTSSSATTSKFTLGAKPVSSLGLIGAAVQIGLIHFLLFISLWGIYSLPHARHLRPKLHATTLEVVMANILLFLTMSAALPLQANLLGLTTITLPTTPSSSLKVHESTTLSLHTTAIRCLPSSTVNCPPPPLNSQTPILIDKSAPTPTKSDLNVLRSGDTKRPTNDDRQSWTIQLHILPQFLNPTSNNHIDPSPPTQNRVPIDPDPLESSTEILPHPKEQSILTQFISQAFGYSVVSPSYGLAMVLILYNVCFLVTSILIAGMRLGHATLSVVSSLRYLQQIDLSSLEPGNPIDVDRSFLMSELAYHNHNHHGPTRSDEVSA